MENKLCYYICAFKMEGHKTFRLLVGRDVEGIETRLKEELGNNKVIEKRFYEVDRLTGNLEEF